MDQTADEATVAKEPTVPDGALSADSAERLTEMYRCMLLIRRFEESAERMHTRGKLFGPFHSSVGEEAVAVGVCSALMTEDVITTTHRGHGHLIAKGADLTRMCAELAGRSTGYCGGLGGSMHLADMGIGAIGENGIVGGSVFLAVGAALGFQVQGLDRVAVGFFGDGGLGQGILFESMTLAALWKLPVVFVCSDNAYAHSFPSRRLPLKEVDARWWEDFGVAGDRLDAVDVRRVFESANEAVGRARGGGGPSFLHFDCYRWRGHNLNDADHLYRSRDEVREARETDPVEVTHDAIVEAGVEIDPDDIASTIDQELDKAWGTALDADLAEPAALFQGVPGIE